MSDPKVNVTIGANVEQFGAAMASATNLLRGFVTVGAFTALAKQAIAFGSALSDLAARNQVTVKWLQEVGYAAQQTGSDLESVANAVTELRRSQAQALGGSSADKAAFRTLGISIEDLKNQGAEALFDRVAEAVRRSGGAVNEVNAALAVLGRQGKSLVAGMTQGFSEMREEAQRLGLILSDDTVKAMDRMGDAIDRAGLKLKGVAAQTLSWIEKISIVPAMFTALSNGIAQDLFTGKFKGALSKVQGLVDGSYMRGIKLLLSPELEPGASGAPPGFGTNAEPAGPIRGNSTPLGVNTDSLKRIGGLVSGSGFSGSNQLLTVQNSALAELRSMKRELIAMNRRRAQGIFEL